jgi:hypothetical protein
MTDLQLPLVEIVYKDLTHIYRVRSQDSPHEQDNVCHRYFQLLTLPFQIGRAIYTRVTQGNAGLMDVPALQHVDGRLRPGTMTLVLAPPGHGKSTFLKGLVRSMPGGTPFSCVWTCLDQTHTCVSVLRQCCRRNSFQP